jgi:hypothetical protein
MEGRDRREGRDRCRLSWRAGPLARNVRRRSYRTSRGCDAPATLVQTKYILVENSLHHRRRGGQSAWVNGTMDEDLIDLDREALVAEVKRLRTGIREHRDSSGHQLCWHHPKLWGLLPEKTDPLPSVPAWPQFLRGCLKYRESLDQQLPKAPRIDDEFEGDR